MKESKLLRLLDKYVGSLLCLVLSIFRRRQTRARSVKKVLVIELFEMGASIMIIPSIKFVLQHQPDAKIYVLTTRGNRASWIISGLIDPNRIICLDGCNLRTFLASALRAIFLLRKERIDLSLDFEKFSRISVVLAVLSGVKRLAGFFRYEHEGLYRGSSLIDAPCSFNQNTHIALNFLALTKTGFLGEQAYPNLKQTLNPEALILPKYSIDDSRKVALREQLGLTNSDSLAVICPDVGANLQIRNYPVESYAQVARHLLDDKSDRYIAIIGVEANRQICDQLANLIGVSRVINLCGKTGTLQDLIELLSISELLLGNDNGPLHFASLTDIPILGIYSTDSPFMYGPLGNAVALYSFFHCSPCISAFNHKSSRCTESTCIKVIAPRTVFDMAKKLLLGQVRFRTINGTTPYIFMSHETRKSEAEMTHSRIGRVGDSRHERLCNVVRS